MKKILTLFLFALIITSTYATARNIYDSTGRNLIYDGTIRGQKRAMQMQQNKANAAAAAKIDYEETSKLVNEKTTIRSNHYHNSEAYKSRHKIK